MVENPLAVGLFKNVRSEDLFASRGMMTNAYILEKFANRGGQEISCNLSPEAGKTETARARPPWGRGSPLPARVPSPYPAHQPPRRLSRRLVLVRVHYQIRQVDPLDGHRSDQRGSALASPKSFLAS